ncbi:MAG TPA: amino acid permease [Solirubrobacterales bacterium]|nr:amino acid permease [Solirubrobacterales bacterium]
MSDGDEREGQGARHDQGPLIQRGVGVPWLFAAVYSAVGFSIYFALGVVADRGLGLTPLIFLGAGLLFILTALTYVEGGAMFRERGGSSTFSRYAFNELVAFIAGWAILIDYLIVLALAALSVPHYLEPFSGRLADPGAEIPVATCVILAVAVLSALDITGHRRPRPLVVLALADLMLQLAVIVVGAFAVWHPERLTDSLDLFGDPAFTDIVYAGVLAMLAYAGIEAASDLAPDIDFPPRALKRVVTVGAVMVPLIYAGMAAVALMAVPVVAGPDGPQTALGTEFVENPVLGVVSAYEPAWVGDAMRWLVALVATPVLFWAASTSMLGVSRHIYTLAINRQIPSWLGKLDRHHATPTVAIAASAVIAIGLILPTNVEVLAGIYAFGALLAITLAHVSIIRMRALEPNRRRPFKVPWGVRIRGVEVPLPALVGAVVSVLAFLSVLAYHDEARWVGTGWMLFGLTAYVIYRRFVEGVSLTERVSVSERALTKSVPEVQYRTLIVPVFGTPLDDDIVGTAGRLAAESDSDGGARARPRLDLVYVIEVPLTLPLDAALPGKQIDEANRVIGRAQEVGSEYPSVDVTARVVRARSVAAGIVEAAREEHAEAIVLGGEPPSRVRGGSILGGVGGPRQEVVGEVTEYVLNRAPCRVLLTAPPEGRAEGDGRRNGAAGSGESAG